MAAHIGRKYRRALARIDALARHHSENLESYTVAVLLSSTSTFC